MQGQKFTISEFRNFCHNELKPSKYLYDTLSQGKELFFSTRQEVSVYNLMDVCLLPNLVSFKNGLSTLTFNRVDYIVLKKVMMDGNLMEFEIVCKNGDRYIIQAYK
jgi:hypothetical protein